MYRPETLVEVVGGGPSAVLRPTPSCLHEEQLQLDVVMLSEFYGIRRVVHPCMRNVEVIESCRPGVKIRTSRDSDGDMVEAGTRLVARLPTVGDMVLESDHYA